MIKLKRLILEMEIRKDMLDELESLSVKAKNCRHLGVTFARQNSINLSKHIQGL